MGRPKGSKNHENDSLEAFARRIEREIVNSNLKDQESMVRLVCRLLTNQKNPAIAAMMASKWVEWRFGKAKETHEHKVQVELNLGDADRIIAGYFIAAGSGQNQAGEGDPGQTAEQALNVLPV